MLLYIISGAGCATLHTRHNQMWSIKWNNNEHLIHLQRELFELHKKGCLVDVLAFFTYKRKTPSKKVFGKKCRFCHDFSFLPLKPSFPSLTNGSRISPRPSSITSISHYYSVKSSQRMTAENSGAESAGAGAIASEVTDFSCQNDLQWGLALWHETKELWHETKKDRLSES